MATDLRSDGTDTMEVATDTASTDTAAGATGLRSDGTDTMEVATDTTSTDTAADAMMDLDGTTSASALAGGATTLTDAMEVATGGAMMELDGTYDADTTTVPGRHRAGNRAAWKRNDRRKRAKAKSKGEKNTGDG